MKNPLADLLTDEIRSFNDVEYFIKCPRMLNADWLWPSQINVIKSFYEQRRLLGINELVCIAGMRSGKTTIASVVEAYETFKLVARGTPFTYYGLPPGGDIFVLNVATSERQALDTVFAQIKARIENSPWFQHQEHDVKYNQIIFPVEDGNITVRSEHSNSGSLAGKTSIAVCLDELSRFVDTGGKSSAAMVYYTVIRQVKTFGRDGLVMSITSPIYQDDFGMQLYRKSQDPANHMFGVLKPTWEMNPNITFQSLEPDFHKDPETTWRDYGCVPSASLETYFKQPWLVEEAADKKIVNLIDDATGKLRLQVFGDPNKVYYLAGDPAFKNDGFGMAMVHREKDGIVADLVYRFEPRHMGGDRREIDASEIKATVLHLANNFRIPGFIIDTWQFPETVQAMERAGVKVVNNVVTKQEYDYLKELIYSRKIKYPYYQKLIEELSQLELSRGSRVDHPRDGSKDCADALANAVYAERTMTIDLQLPIYVSIDY